MNAFFGEVNEMRADDDMDDVDALSSDGPAPIDRSCWKRKIFVPLRNDTAVIYWHI